MDKRLRGKVLQSDGGVAGEKLAAGPSFLANLSSTGSVLATVRVTTPHYVPDNLALRMRISPTMFTATMSKEGLVGALEDADVLVVQPSQPVRSASNT